MIWMNILRAFLSKCSSKSSLIAIQRWPYSVKTLSSRASLTRPIQTFKPWRLFSRRPSSRSRMIKTISHSKRWKLSRVSRGIRFRRKVYCRSSLNSRRFTRSKSRISRERTMRVSRPWKLKCSSWSKNVILQLKIKTRLRMSWREPWLTVRWKIVVSPTSTKWLHPKRLSFKNWVVKIAKLESGWKVWQLKDRSICPRWRLY